MFLLFTIFTTRMRKDHVVIFRFLITTTITFVSRQLVLSIVEIAIRTSPCVKCSQWFTSMSDFSFFNIICSLLKFILIHSKSTSILILNFIFFIIIILFFYFFSCVKFTDPFFDTSQMDWNMTLFTSPDSTSLIDRILANNALLGSIWKSLHEIFTFIC